MTLDKECDVAVQAVRLIINIDKYHREILSDKNYETVYELAYSTRRAVAQAAGDFLNERHFTLDEATPTLLTRCGKKRRPNTPRIQDLVQFFIESEVRYNKQFNYFSFEFIFCRVYAYSVTRARSIFSRFLNRLKRDDERLGVYDRFID